jgi:nicotinate-nucleotide adenylyltransferase
MLKLATGGHPAFEIWTGELSRGGVSYTIDTIRAIREEHPAAELFLLLGTDMLADLPRWREPEEILHLASPVVVGRPMSSTAESSRCEPTSSSFRIDHSTIRRLDMPEIGISSSEIRARVATGRSVRYMTPRSVEKYIQTHDLYRPRD